MSNSLRILIDLLHGSNIHTSGEELADALWLASRMGELEAMQTTREQMDEEKVPPATPAEQSARPILLPQPPSDATIIAFLIRVRYRVPPA